MAALSFMLGFVAVTGSYVMRLIPKTQALQAVLVHFFRVQPPFLLGEGLIELTRFNFERDLARARFGADAPATSTPASNSAVQQTTGGLSMPPLLHAIDCLILREAEGSQAENQSCIACSKICQWFEGQDISGNHVSLMSRLL